jgi:hypothetical protein
VAKEFIHDGRKAPFPANFHDENLRGNIVCHDAVERYIGRDGFVAGPQWLAGNAGDCRRRKRS